MGPTYDLDFHILKPDLSRQKVQLYSTSKYLHLNRQVNIVLLFKYLNKIEKFSSVCSGPD